MPKGYIIVRMTVTDPETYAAYVQKSVVYGTVSCQ